MDLSALPIGEIAGLTTALLWSMSSTSFTIAGRDVGSFNVNRWRLIFAVLYLIIVHTILYGHPIPLNASTEAWIWLGLSGLIGLVLGDSLLFRSFMIIGPRSAMVLMTLAPVFSTILAWTLLAEHLSVVQITAILVTVTGVSWAIMHHSQGIAPSGEGSHRLGIFAGIIAALAQAAGLVLTRKAMDTGVAPFEATIIRMLMAMIMIWILTAIRGQLKSSFTLFKHGRALKFLTIGCLIGPFLGMWLSLVSVRFAPVGVASTLMSTTSIFLIPISHLVLRERIHKQSIIGTIIAVIGIGVLLGAGNS